VQTEAPELALKQLRQLAQDSAAALLQLGGPQLVQTEAPPQAAGQPELSLKQQGQLALDSPEALLQFGGPLIVQIEALQPAGQPLPQPAGYL
jgi:hypothetical protein